MTVTPEATIEALKVSANKLEAKLAPYAYKELPADAEADHGKLSYSGDVYESCGSEATNNSAPAGLQYVSFDGNQLSWSRDFKGFEVQFRETDNPDGVYDADIEVDCTAEVDIFTAWPASDGPGVCPEFDTWERQDTGYQELVIPAEGEDANLFYRETLIALGEELGIKYDDGVSVIWEYVDGEVTFRRVSGIERRVVWGPDGKRVGKAPVPTIQELQNGSMVPVTWGEFRRRCVDFG